ncbi:MAG: ribosome silencing factor [Rhodospirillales bacterium]|jgi:ribosome-associated protein
MFIISQKINMPNKSKSKSKKNFQTRSIELLDITKASLESNKAEDVVAINLIGKASFADHMVIATGTSQRHVASMAVHLKEKMKTTGLKEVMLEGTTQNDWVLIDGGDVIVHLFTHEIREFYAIEKIWSGDMPQSNNVA